MRIFRRIVAATRFSLFSFWLFALQTPQPGQGLGGFVPVNQLPPSDRLPAAPVLIVVYALVWIAVIVYIWSVWRRLDRIDGEMHELKRRG
jgi:CcmD family protein